MNLSTIAHSRLKNQQISKPDFTSAVNLVQWMGAVQAQDYSMAKWAIGVRVPESTDAMIEDAIDRAEIIRTHILRPTWHFVAATDCRWMMDLTAPHINRIAGTHFRQLGLDDKLFRKTNKSIEKVLQNGDQLTRAEILQHLKKSRINVNDEQAGHIMFRAELDKVVCNGSRRGKQFTYALFDQRIPSAEPLKRVEALAKLARRYFTSHGPALLTDFIWWSGLSITDAKAGLEEGKSSFSSMKINAHEYWYSEPGGIIKPSNTVYLLPSFDEFTIGYSDRSASLDVSLAKKTILANGIFKPIMVINGKVAGLWKRTESKGRIVVEVTPLIERAKIKKRLLAAAVTGFGKFLNKSVDVKV